MVLNPGSLGAMLWNPSSIPGSSRLYIVSVLRVPVLTWISRVLEVPLRHHLFCFFVICSAYIHNTFLAILVNFLWGRRHGLGLSVLQVLDVVVNEQYPVSTEVRVG